MERFQQMWLVVVLYCFPNACKWTFCLNNNKKNTLIQCHWIGFKRVKDKLWIHLAAVYVLICRFSTNITPMNLYQCCIMLIIIIISARGGAVFRSKKKCFVFNNNHYITLSSDNLLKVLYTKGKKNTLLHS